MRNWYNIGMGVGLLIGLIVILINSRRMKKNKKCQWDERQIAARGKCFMIGFWTLIVASTFIALYGFFVGKSLFETPETGNIIAVLIGIGAFAIAAINNDAYFSLHENKKQFFNKTGLEEKDFYFNNKNNLNPIFYQSAIYDTIIETKQAVEALYHNLNN